MSLDLLHPVTDAEHADAAALHLSRFPGSLSAARLYVERILSGRYLRAARRTLERIRLDRLAGGASAARDAAASSRLAGVDVEAWLLNRAERDLVDAFRRGLVAPAAHRGRPLTE